MITLKNKTLYLFVLILTSLVTCGYSQEDKKNTEKKTDKQEKTPAKQEMTKVPGFKIDVKKKEVRMEAEICLTTGLLEYLVCLPQTFEHEAIFVTKSKPQILHAALLMIGREPTHLMKEKFKWWEVIKKRPKSRLKIDVEWKDKKGKLQRIPLHKLLIDRGAKEDAKEEERYAKDEWYFNGSFFIDGKYAAIDDATVIAVQPMGSSVIQYGIDAGNPYSGDHIGFAINSKLCPKYGTKVDLIFSEKKIEKKDNKKDKK
jgi:hypothetical protein